MVNINDLCSSISEECREQYLRIESSERSKAIQHLQEIVSSPNPNPVELSEVAVALNDLYTRAYSEFSTNEKQLIWDVCVNRVIQSPLNFDSINFAVLFSSVFSTKDPSVKCNLSISSLIERVFYVSGMTNLFKSNDSTQGLVSLQLTQKEKGTYGAFFCTLRKFISPEQYMEVFAQMKEYLNPVSTNICMNVSLLLHNLYPSHFFSFEMADTVMAFFKYGSSRVGSFYLPVIARMMNGDESHQYSWSPYLSELCICCSNSINKCSSDDTHLLISYSDLITQLIMIGPVENGIPKGAKMVMLFLRSYLPFIQPGNSFTGPLSGLVFKLLDLLFKSIYRAIQHQIKAFMNGKLQWSNEWTPLINVSNQHESNVNRLCNSPILKVIMDFFEEVFICSLTKQDLSGCNSLHHIVNFRPSAVMKAIKETCNEVMNDDTAKEVLRRVLKESSTIHILLYEMFTDGMIDSESSIKLEYIDFVDYLMDFCTKVILESNNVNSIVNCLSQLTNLFKTKEMNQYNSITQYPDAMDVWARRVIPSLVRTFLVNNSLFTNGFENIRFGLFFENVSRLLSPDVKPLIMKDCIDLIIEDASVSFTANDQFLKNLRQLKDDDSLDKYILMKVKSIFSAYLLPKNTPVEFKSGALITDLDEFKRCCNIINILFLWCGEQSICQFLDDYKQSFFVLCASSQREVNSLVSNLLASLLFGNWHYIHQYEHIDSFLYDAQSLHRYYTPLHIEPDKRLISFIVRTFYIPVVHYLNSEYESLDISLLCSLFSLVAAITANIFNSNIITRMPDGDIPFCIESDVYEEYQKINFAVLLSKMLSRIQDSDSLVNSEFLTTIENMMCVNYMGVIDRINMMPMSGAPQSRQCDKALLCLSLLMKYRQMKQEERGLKFMSTNRIIHCADAVYIYVSFMRCICYCYKPSPKEFVEPFLSFIKLTESQSNVIQGIVVNMCTLSYPHAFRVVLYNALLERLERLLNQELETPDEKTSHYVVTLISSICRVDKMVLYDTVQDPAMTIRLMSCIQRLYDMRNKVCIETDKEMVTNAIAAISSWFAASSLDSVEISSELISFLIDQLMSSTTTTRRAFYICFITNLRSRMDFEIPVPVIISILKSFNSIAYKMAVRLFVYCKEDLLEALASLSKEDQDRALHLIVHDGLTMTSDVVVSKENPQDAYSSELRNYLIFNCDNVTSFDLIFHTGMSIIKINSLAVYYMRVVTYLCAGRKQWSQIMVNECLDLLVCPEDRKAYSTAVVSSIFTTALITCDFINAESPHFCNIDDFLKRVQDLNVPYLTKTLLYGLLFMTTYATLPTVIRNINHVMTLLMDDPNRITLLLVICILLFIYLYDGNYQLIPTRRNIDRGDSDLLINQIDMQSIASLLNCSFDLTLSVFKAYLPSLLLLNGYEPSTIVDHLLSAQREIESLEDKTKIVYAIASLSSCYAIETTYMIPHFPQNSYDVILRAFCVGLIKCHNSTDLIKSLADKYSSDVMKATNIPSSFASIFIDELLKAIRVETNPQNLSSLLHIIVIVVVTHYRYYISDTEHEIIQQVISFLTHPNKTIRESAQSDLALLLYSLEDAQKHDILKNFIKTVITNEEEGIRGIAAFVESDGNGFHAITKEALTFLIHYHPKGKGLDDIIGKVVTDFRKSHVKRLKIIRNEFDSDDWELIESNSTYISYIV